MRNTFDLQQNEAVLVAFRISKLRGLNVAIYVTSDFSTIVKSSQKLKSFSHVCNLEALRSDDTIDCPWYRNSIITPHSALFYQASNNWPSRTL